MILHKGLYFAIVFLLVLTACSSSGNELASDYKVPDMPGPSTVVNGTIVVTPVLLNDYMPNPGIGWQHRPEKTEISDFPETVFYSNRRLIGWKFLNPQEGVYNWAPLDSQLNEAVEAGKQFSFRVYTMVGEDYDGHMVPAWVIEEGAGLLETGEPDYSSCVYQDEWADFVEKLIRRYDGNPDIAFIDISGYGDFNEWSWSDEQTEWDEAWEEDYVRGKALPENFQTLDGQARRRLADMFIGGTNNVHDCRAVDGTISTVSYFYDGFRETQLLMPYAGIVQSTQYVYSRRADVGFRSDCLGWNTDRLMEKVGDELLKIWKTAPVAFELCKPEDVSLEEVQSLTVEAHATLIHDNEWKFSNDVLVDLMRSVGYRYFLKEADLKVTEDSIELGLTWQNVGYAPSYPKMGQEFQLYAHVLNKNGESVITVPLDADISSWMPALNLDQTPFQYKISQSLPIPSNIDDGEYLLGVSILDLRRQIPINLAFGGRDVHGINILSWIEIR